MILERDILSNVICNIRTPMASGGENVGTAILITKTNQDAILLTAEHVAKEISPSTVAVISDLKGNTKRISLDILLGGAAFEYHPVADLAKAEIIINKDNSDLITGRCFPFSQVDLTENMLSRDEEFTTIGFPLGLGANGAKFTPLSYRSYISAPAITFNRFDNGKPCDFIIMENPTTGGYSGGPMFDLGYSIYGGMHTSKGKTVLHGIIHGTITDQTGGKLGAVTPTKYLKDWL